ncbi:MAG: sigma-70 family RNA polymerase sigma factor [Gemmatimonadota bacterium]
MIDLDGGASSRTATRSEITRILSEFGSGGSDAFDRLIPLVYDDLRHIAHRRLQAERSGHTLDTTAVVHEAYVRLAESPVSTWHDRAHFFAVCARVIRHVLVDHARRRNSKKRGGNAVHVPLRDHLEGTSTRISDVLALEEALRALERHDERMVRVVECRYFAGLTVAETADALDTSRRTVERCWTRAKAHLYRSLSADAGTPAGAA